MWPASSRMIQAISADLPSLKAASQSTLRDPLGGRLHKAAEALALPDKAT